MVVKDCQAPGLDAVARGGRWLKNRETGLEPGIHRFRLCQIIASRFI
jgi:hypothetical protein